MKVQLTLASRYLAGRKLRTFLTTLAIVFGVMLILGLNAILPGMLNAMKQQMLASVGQVDLTVTSKSDAAFQPGVADQVARVDGIQAASGVLRRNVAVPRSLAEGLTNIYLVGFDPATLSQVRAFPLAKGRFLNDSDASGDTAAIGSGPTPSASWTPSVVLPIDTADRLKVGVGDTVEIPSAFGTTKVRVVGTVNVPMPPGGDEAYVTLPAAQSILGTGDRITEVDASYKTGVDRAAVERSVQAAVGPDFKLGAVETSSTLFASIRVGQFIINMFGVFALVMAGFIILNTFRTVVAERRHDIGMLRAVGARQSTILGMFLTESLIQGALGTAIGLALGVGLAFLSVAGLNSVMDKLLNLPPISPQFPVSTWVMAIGLGVGITVVSALVPARAAARITPLDALRPHMGEVYEKEVNRRAWVGVALVALSVVGLLSQEWRLVGLSSVVFIVALVLLAPWIVKPVTDVFSRLIELIYRREGGVARANMLRNPGRSAVTASAMMVSVGIIIALLGVLTSVFTGFTNYLDKSMGANFLIVPSNMLLSLGTVGADQQFVQAIKDTPGVGDVATLRIAQATYKGGSMQVIGIDPVAYPKVASFEFSKGSSQADLSRLNGNTIMVNGIFAAQNGIAKGDSITLQTPSGPRTYKVVAVGSDYLNAKLATTYISQAAIERDFGVKTAVLTMANAKPGSDVKATLERLKTTVAKYPSFTLYDSQEWKTIQVNTFNQYYNVFYVLLAILATPSLLALLNTLAIGVLARTREIGMLRAVGSTRRQVKRMIVAESLLLASLGTLLGILAGVWLGYAMTDAMNAVGFKTPYYFPVNGIIAALLIGVGFGIIAALIPARQAAKLDVVRALQYE